MTVQELKAQAARLRTLQPDLSQVQALQMIARLHGYRDWQTAKAALERPAPNTYLVTVAVHDAETDTPTLTIKPAWQCAGLSAAYAAARDAVRTQVDALGLAEPGDSGADVTALEEAALTTLRNAQRRQEPAAQVTVPLSTVLRAPDFTVDLQHVSGLAWTAPPPAPDGPVPVFTVATVEEGAAYADVLPVAAYSPDEVVSCVRRTLAASFEVALSAEGETHLRQACAQGAEAARDPDADLWSGGAVQLAPGTVTVLNVVTFLPARPHLN
ncbi:glyoxalase superfamily protein [Deinococcus soli (ex Cha et al. 2016)]|uniref:Uncharacterized protein n=2 Tax=Deinococcus soli (ex Cha et al. 2016) TaxID=1309411 RepID=A0ACC6KH03_9DEIO|nr:glyoxalase superfamily protein [Deinococcus soli (ex Cha et al. 2016)]MDR6219034.1 hypothetical protein [Deinococcus soli (ex Cha et al. 2016)]MDR6328831.1 hypothetical protein [Deinococcus soli (ex Cha et al. 2016)]MDR6751681.1 hypothetical protein [Deinococcus soli (ex Cha et al. 2016)]